MELVGSRCVEEEECGEQDQQCDGGVGCRSVERRNRKGAAGVQMLVKREKTRRDEKERKREGERVLGE